MVVGFDSAARTAIRIQFALRHPPPNPDCDILHADIVKTGLKATMLSDPIRAGARG
ncbi:hypothetical protein OH77DRAFT_1522064 [Trametes cingulata]|nr:hypothetical protein OH77DRAFT_1522064 [Trametes cingulata]